MIDKLFDGSVVEDPHEYYAQLRGTDPVHLVEGTNTYLVTRLDLVHEVVGDPDTYSSNSNAFLWLGPDRTPALRDALGDAPSADGEAVSVIATADPPVHTRQRKVLSALFSRRSIDSREEEFRAVVDSFLDRCLDRGRVEWMSEVAEPAPSVMVARILGMDDSTAPFLKETGFASVEQIGGFVTDDRRSELRDVMTRLGPVGEAYERARSAGPVDPDTVIGACANAVVGGDMDDLEAIATLLLVVSAGTESTTSLLGTGARLIAENEDLQRALRADPSLVENFVEEACRVDPPFRGHYRRVTRDTRLGGVPVPAGARLVLVWPAANRDPAGFDAPEEIRLDRPAPRHHVGFGWGIHLCLGAPLARLEARVTFQRLLERSSHVAVAVDDDGLRHHRSLMIRRLVELPLRLDT